MSRIDELIREFAPGGIEYKPLGELLNYEQPTKYLVSSKSYDDSFVTPVLTAGQTFVLGYTSETHGIYRASPDSAVVIFDDFTTAFKWVDFPFKVKSSAMKILTAKPGVLLRYVWFVMQSIRYEPQEHARQWISTYSGFRVPVPPPEVQREIVASLDAFTELEAELEAELAARRQQYAHYRDYFLSFKGRADVSWVPVGKLGTWVGGVTPSKSNPLFWDGGTIPWLASMDVSTAVGPVKSDAIRGRVTAAAVAETPAKVVKGPSVAVVMRSNVLRRFLPIAFVDADTTVNQDLRTLSPGNGIVPRYIYQVLQAESERLRSACVRTDGSMAAVDATRFFAWEVPIPAIAEQRRIADVLDKFDALVNDLSSGLPAEIKARRQQYEYYRDRLLSFEESPA